MRHSAILAYTVVSVPHCGLFNRWHQLFPLAKTSFHSEYFAGWAVANARCFGVVAARKWSESCIKTVSGRSQLVCAVRILQPGSFGRLQNISSGKLVPTSQSSRQRGIRRFWFTLSFLCRIAAYLIVLPHMSPVAPFLEIAVVWNDPDMQEVVVSASSGKFSGKVNLYAGLNELKEVVEQLNGFPRSRDDKREFTLGQNDLPGYGIASLIFYCRDSTGHVALEVALQSTQAYPLRGNESAIIVIPAVVGDIDRFMAELRNINNRVGARAVLQSEF